MQMYMHSLQCKSLCIKVSARRRGGAARYGADTLVVSSVAAHRGFDPSVLPDSRLWPASVGRNNWLVSLEGGIDKLV